jgi:LCP family protein required for cell wall assembly
VNLRRVARLHETEKTLQSRMWWELIGWLCLANAVFYVSLFVGELYLAWSSLKIVPTLSGPPSSEPALLAVNPTSQSPLMAEPTFVPATPSLFEPPTPGAFVPPTPTATLVFTATLIPSPTPSSAPVAVAQPVPTAVPPVTLPPDTVTILLLGSDRREGWTHWRTDSIILVAVDTRGHTAGLLSIPRDLWVYIPGHGNERINTAELWGEMGKYPGGGPASIKKTIEYNLGLPVHYYVRVDLQGFVKIIDTLGGVTVDVDCPLSDRFPDPDSPTGFTDLDLVPGIHHLDGKMAQYYSRSRLSTSDYDRSRRQQKVIRGIWEQGLRLDILPKIPELWQTLGDTFQTDLSLEQVLTLAYLGTQMEPQNIHGHFIGRSAVTGWVTPKGAQVMLPNHEKIREVVAQFLAPPPLDLVWAEGARVEVQNGTDLADWTELVASRLRWQGVQVVSVGPADRFDYQESLMMDYTDKPHTLALLSRVLYLPPDRIQRQLDFSSPVDIRIILGRDFQPCHR